MVGNTPGAKLSAQSWRRAKKAKGGGELGKNAWKKVKREGRNLNLDKKTDPNC